MAVTLKKSIFLVTQIENQAFLAFSTPDFTSSNLQ